EVAAHYRDSLIHRTSALELQNTQIDQRRQEAVLAIGLVRHAMAQHAEILRLEDGMRILRQQAHVRETQLARADAPAHEQFAEPQEEEQMFEILDRERVGEVR